LSGEFLYPISKFNILTRFYILHYADSSWGFLIFVNMEDFMKPDINVVIKVTQYSLLIRDLRLTLLQVRRAILMLNNLRIPIHNKEEMRNLESELLYKLEEVERSCKLLLQPVFGGIDFGNDKMNHWHFSSEDIRNGYCRLEEVLHYKNDRPVSFGRRYILLLEDYTDNVLGKFYGGELVPLETAVDFLDNIPVRTEKVKGVFDAYINNLSLAMSYRTKRLL
jgi:hypothetical protein